MPRKLYAQRDIVLGLVEDASPSKPLPADADHVVVLARGELTGRAHAFYRGGVTLFRDEALAASWRRGSTSATSKSVANQPTCGTRNMRR